MEYLNNGKISYKRPSLNSNNKSTSRSRAWRSRNVGNPTVKKNSNGPMNTGVRIKPDHTVIVHAYGPFEFQNTQSGYFDHYENIKPHTIILNSPYKYLLEIYESVRVTSITARFYLPAVSVNTTGVTAGMYYRDILTVQPSRYREQLICEPGHKSGRAATVYTFNWRPIEPSDYEFYDHAQFGSMDDGRYGQVNFAGSGLTNPDSAKPFLEYTMKVDFKSLVAPPIQSEYRPVRPSEAGVCLKTEDVDDLQDLGDFFLPSKRIYPSIQRR